MEKKSIISDYESGRAIPNSAIIGKIERALGVRFPKDSKKNKKNKNV
jgi:putative transcription factor